MDLKFEWLFWSIRVHAMVSDQMQCWRSQFDVQLIFSMVFTMSYHFKRSKLLVGYIELMVVSLFFPTVVVQRILLNGLFLKFTIVEMLIPSLTHCFKKRFLDALHRLDSFKWILVHKSSETVIWDRFDLNTDWLKSDCISWQ